MKRKQNSYWHSVRAAAAGLIFCLAVVMVLMIAACGNFMDTGETNSQPQPSLNVDVTGADSQLTVTWNAIEDASSYEVWLDGIKIDETPITIKVLTGLENQRLYHVVIRTLVNGKYIQSDPESGKPDIIPTPPETPKGLRVLADDRSLFASWPPVAGATSYEVFLDNAYWVKMLLP